MIKGDYDYLEKLAGYNECAEHHKAVVVAWHSGEKCWTLRCGSNHYPDSLARIPSITEEGRQMALDEPGNDGKNKRGSARAPTKQATAPQAVTMKGIPAADLGTGELLPPEVVRILIDFAERYNLDPVRGHVVMMYGKPYITLDGYLYHANKSKVPYRLESRPMTDAERGFMQLAEGDHGWMANLELLTTGAFFVGTGIVTRDEMTEESKRKPGQLASPVVATHPWQLAQKRAEWQALRRGFPIGGEQ